MRQFITAHFGGQKGREGKIEEKPIEQRFHLLGQEVEAAVTLVEPVKLNYVAAADGS